MWWFWRSGTERCTCHGRRPAAAAAGRSSGQPPLWGRRPSMARTARPTYSTDAYRHRSLECWETRSHAPAAPLASAWCPCRRTPASPSRQGSSTSASAGPCRPSARRTSCCGAASWTSPDGPLLAFRSVSQGMINWIFSIFIMSVVLMACKWHEERKKEMDYYDGEERLLKIIEFFRNADHATASAYRELRGIPARCGHRRRGSSSY